MDRTLEIRSDVQSLSSPAKKQLLIETAASLTPEEKQEVSRALSLPTQGITDWLWLIIVLAFAIVLVGAFLALARVIGVDVDIDKMLTVFTTVSAFLAGLLVPSPLGSKR